MSVYLDTSFLVSLYVTDVRSLEARRLIRTISPSWFTPLHAAEVAHALAQHVFRGQLTSSEVATLTKQVEGDKAQGVWRALRTYPNRHFRWQQIWADAMEPNLACGRSTAYTLLPHSNWARNASGPLTNANPSSPRPRG